MNSRWVTVGVLSVGGLTVGGRQFVVDSRWWTVGGGQLWAVVGGQKAGGGRQWARQWTVKQSLVGSGRWAVDSETVLVGSGQWTVKQSLVGSGQ